MQIDSVELICSFLNRKKPLHQQRTLRLAALSQTKLDNVPNDIIFEITLYLDVVQIARLFSISPRFTKISIERIVERVNTYKEIIKYAKWNEGLAVAASKADFPQLGFFISKGADKLETALAKACLNGHTIVVQYLLELGAQITGDVIAHSVTGGHQQLTTLLLKDTHLSRKDLKKILCAAIKIKDGVIVNDFRRLIKEHPKPFPIKDAVCAAAESGNISYMIYLEKHHKKIPWDKAFQSAAGGGQIKSLCFVWGRLEKHQRISLTLDWALSPAAKNGHFATVKWLIARGASHNRWGQIAAAEGGHKEIVKYFTHAGATIINETFIAAAKGNNMDLIKYLFLVKPNICSSKSLDKMAVEAVKNNNIELLEFLHAKGIQFEGNLLLGAVHEGHTSMYHWLVKHKVSDIFLKNPDHTYGLEIAAKHGHLTLVKYLWNSSSKTPIIIARAWWAATHPRVKKYLEEEMIRLNRPMEFKLLLRPEEQAQISKRLRELEEFKPNKKQLIELSD